MNPNHITYHSDHLGSASFLTDNNGSETQQLVYLPFGEDWVDMKYNSPAYITPYKFNGKEKDPESGYNYYGARYYYDWATIWLSVDPLSDKYPHLTSYNYCANNPVMLVDPDGREIDIEFGTGFWGLKTQKVTYENGRLYNKDGSLYTDKVKGFLRETVAALDNLNKTDEGSSLIKELESSSHVFTIKQSSKTQFEADNAMMAGANLKEFQDGTGINSYSNGSGGTIFWNPYSNSGGIDTYGKTTRPAYIGLGHEMGHASDANKGLLHFRKDHMGYRCEHNGLFKSEWRAVYRENLIRSQAGIPLRTHHGLDNGYGSGPRLLDSNNKPINYSGL